MLVLGFESEIEIELYGPDPLPIGATLVAQVRESVAASKIPATLSTTDGTIQILSSGAASSPEPGFEFVAVIVLTFPGSVTKDFRATRLVTDIVRTDGNPDQYLGFQLAMEFAKPATRGLE